MSIDPRETFHEFTEPEILVELAKTGVFVLFKKQGAEYRAIYVGSSDFVQNKVLALRTDPCITNQSPTHFQYEICVQSQMRNREQQLKDKYLPSCA